MAEYVLPSLGADMESATIVEWQVRPGDAVHKGQVVGMVETEKATMDIEFFRDGVVEEVLVPVGQRVNVGTPVIRFRPAEAGAPAPAPAVPVAPPAVPIPAPVAEPLIAAAPAFVAAAVAVAAQAAVAAPAPVAVGAPPIVAAEVPAAVAVGAPVATPVAVEAAAETMLEAIAAAELVHRVHPPVEHLAHELGVDLAIVEGTGPGGRVTKHDVRAAAEAKRRAAITPRARRLAEEHRLDLSLLAGTGPDGSITFEDVERTIAVVAAAAAPELVVMPNAPAPVETPPEPVPAAAEAAAPSTAPAAPQTPAELAAQRALAMRHALAVLMARSKREIPHYYLQLDVDMSRPLAWLADENARLPMADRLLPASLLVKATALALREFPEMNGFWMDDRFVPGSGIHTGVAVSLRGGGLVAPAIHDADQKTLGELMAAMRDLVTRSRSGSLHRAEMADPTITITNLGDQGVDLVHGVIYPPQVALVGFGRVRERAVAVDGLVGARPVMTATLAADHRNSDGHRGGLFLAAIERHLQEPEKL